MGVLRKVFRISRYNIAFRLFVMTAVTGSLFAATILYSLAEMKHTRASLEHVTNTIGKLVSNAHAIRNGVHLDENAVLNLIVAQDQVQKMLAKVRLISLRAQVADSIDYLLANNAEPSTRDIVLQVREKITTAYKNQDRLIQIVSERGFADSISYYLEVIKPEFQNLTEQCELFAAIQETERDKHYAIASQAYSRSRTIFIAVSSLLFIISIWLCWYISRSITGPIDKAVSIAGRLAESNYDVDIDSDESGEPGRLLVSMKQMAEKLEQVRDIEQRLIQSQKLETVGQLAGGVAHDFNNLLTAIFGHCDLALADIEDIRSCRDHIEGILKAAQRAGGLTNQLLAFSRRQVLKPAVINLNHLIEDLRKMMERLIPENIMMQIHLGKDLGNIKVDQVQIEQVLLNLVVNARDAIPDGGRIVIETANVCLDEQSAGLRVGVAPERYVVLGVSDSGVGMTPEVKARIFEPFFTTKEMGRGSGLGLSTVYGIVKQSGGNVWVYSEPGMGTQFKIYLPIIDETPCEPIEPEKAPARSGKGETILVVEDDGEVREVVKSLLSGLGYRLIVSGHPQDAISKMTSTHPAIDLLITDVVMPGMSGYALAELFLRHYPGSPVLYMSGYANSNLNSGGEMAAGFDYIQKPFTSDALLSKVRSILDSSPLAIEIRTNPGVV
jgi:signal transduction histidine kinase/CheY-like chemotaxis protein